MDINKRQIYLIGAGELAREVESWISLDKKILEQWNIAGFLDQNLNAVDNYPSDYKVLGTPETFNFQPNDAAIICVANPVIKKRIVEAIAHKVQIISYISSHAIIGKFASIGKGVVVCPNTVISTNAIIEDYTTFNCGCQIGHDCFVGKFSSLMPHVDLGGHVKIGKESFLGTKTTIIPKRILHNNITIGAGSVVVRNLKKAGTYFGNPASSMKF